MENNEEKTDQFPLGNQDDETRVAEVDQVGTADCGGEPGDSGPVVGGNVGPDDSQPIQGVSCDDAAVDQGAAGENPEDGGESRDRFSRPASGGDEPDSRDSDDRLLRLIECDRRIGQLITSLLNGETPQEAIDRLVSDAAPKASTPQSELGIYELVRYGLPDDPGLPDDEDTSRVLSSPRHSVWNRR